MGLIAVTERSDENLPQRRRNVLTCSTGQSRSRRIGRCIAESSRSLDKAWRCSLPRRRQRRGRGSAIAARPRWHLTRGGASWTCCPSRTTWRTTSRSIRPSSTFTRWTATDTVATTPGTSPAPWPRLDSAQHDGNRYSATMPWPWASRSRPPPWRWRDGRNWSRSTRDRTQPHRAIVRLLGVSPSGRVNAIDISVNR